MCICSFQELVRQLQILLLNQTHLNTCVNKTSDNSFNSFTIEAESRHNVRIAVTDTFLAI